MKRMTLRNRKTLRTLMLGAAAAGTLTMVLTGCSSHRALAAGPAPSARSAPAPAPAPATSNVYVVARASTPRCLTAAQAMALVKTRTGPNVVLDAVHGYGCAGGWAYVNYRQVPYGNQATKALQYLHGTWVIGDRLLGCGDSGRRPAMPASIARYGCGN